MSTITNKSNMITTMARMQDVLQLLCDSMEREAPLHNALVFLTIAEAHAKGGTIEIKEIQKLTGLTSSATSRAVGALGEWSYKKRPGLDLIKSRPDYEDRRRKPMVLTEKGEELAKKVTALLNP